ncbi:MAG: hypothetical protein JSV04_02755 [Candidatus Heimdallarchaeota archaeon]|nr:MAG: hypothetical protein JSV04_02755 [Candidatus Heimdallarchaeota archaeon]
MLDLIASKGTKELLEYIRDHPKEENTSVSINAYFTKDASIQLTTATVYRRLKELELAGLIIRDPPDSNTFILTPQAADLLDNQILRHPEITELGRAHRALLRQIKQSEGAKVVELQEIAQMSPTTINVGLQKLSNLGLIEQIKNHIPRPSEQPKLSKKKKTKPGRPAKRHRLTKKGKEVYEQQQKLEKK